MKFRICIIYAFIFLALGAFAETRITGTVTEMSGGSPITGANVIIKDRHDKMLAFGVTGLDGEFSIASPAADDSLAIQVTAIGYKTHRQTLPAGGGPLDIRLEDGALQLREVVVNAARIRESGDTVTYLVGAFAQKQDRTIGDVLSRMPGIDVESSGKIKYQGTDINKLYIEGSDLLGGKYGIATNGISHDDIGAVEVLENHQPMQVLRGLSFSDQAAINLKMKDGSKASLLAHGSAGGGWSRQPRGALWKADAFTMMATGKYQMITTAKGDNTGASLSDQLADFTFGGSGEGMGGYISLTPPSAPNLKKRRSYFNRSWMASSSHLLKTGNGGELKAQIDYSNDRVAAQGASSTTYFLESGDRVILEDRSSLEHRSAATGKFSYELNEKTYFLSNTLSAALSWNDLTLHTAGTVPNAQQARMPEYSVSNTLKLIKRFGGNKLVTFESRNEWSSMPERLTVSHDGKDYGQRIRQSAFLTDEKASLTFVIRRIMVSFEGGAAGYFRSLDTGLWGIDGPELVDNERLTTDYLRLYAAPDFKWKHRKLELSLNFPVNLYAYFFSGGLRNRTELFVSPSLSARYSMSPRMSLTLRGSARRSPASLHSIHDSSILTDYRSFTSGVDGYYASSGQSVSMHYAYRNATHGLFLTAMGSYGWNKSKFGMVQNIVGDYVFHSYRSQPSDSRNAMAMLNASKTLDFIRGAVGLKASYRMADNSMLSQGVATDYRNDTYSLSPSINGNISSFLNWNLRFTWDRSSLKISDMARRNSNNFMYSGSVTLTPHKLITLTAGGEFYHNEIEAGRYKDMTMLDTRLTFNISKRLEISASLTNMLNKKSYSYTSYATISQYERSSLLRGRELLITIYIRE